MVCEHLAAAETALTDAGIAITYRGQPWSRNCREWVYFDADIDAEALRARLRLGDTVRVHENGDPKSGIERGLYCEACHDAVMGRPGAAIRIG